MSESEWVCRSRSRDHPSLFRSVDVRPSPSQKLTRAPEHLPLFKMPLFCAYATLWRLFYLVYGSVLALWGWSLLTACQYHVGPRHSGGDDQVMLGSMDDE